jgi:hypothetical protein
MGLLKKIFQVKTYLITFAAGALVHRCVSADERYLVTRMEHDAYLVDKQTKTKIPINPESFQSGTLEYRVEGILAEPELADLLYHLQSFNKGGKKQ